MVGSHQTFTLPLLALCVAPLAFACTDDVAPPESAATEESGETQDPATTDPDTDTDPMTESDTETSMETETGAETETGVEFGPCTIVSEALPDAVQASPYALELELEGEGCAGASVTTGACGLPPGLELVGAELVGTPEYGGPYPIDLVLLDPEGGELDQRELWLEVETIADTRADLDHDGDVDDDDELLFDAAHTGELVPALLEPTSDAGIRSGAGADTNFDSLVGDVIPVELDNEPDSPGEDTWKAYLQFDLSSLDDPDGPDGSIVGAELRLTTQDEFGGPVPAQLRVDVFGLLDGNDGWDEATITWNNAPANVDDDLDLVASAVYGAGPLGTFESTGGVDSFSSPALDAYLTEAAGGDGRVTLVLVVESNTAADGDYNVWHSREAGELGPRLSLSRRSDSPADFDLDGDVDVDDRAVFEASHTGPLSGEVALCWRRYVERALETLVDHGTDDYGPTPTQMLMSVIELDTLTAPALPEGPEPCPDEDVTATPAGYPADACLRTEGRPDHGRLSLGGSNLFLDQALLRTMYRLSEVSGDAQWSEAADAYVLDAFERAIKHVEPMGLPPNNTFVWGSHAYYDAYADGFGGENWSSGPLVGAPIHEMLIKQPEWGELYRVDPAATEEHIESIWDWHVIDEQSGLHNRHDDETGGVLDFAYGGGNYALAFAFMHAQTQDELWRDRGHLMVQRHLDFTDPDTGLVPDAPNAGARYDGQHMMTSVSGPAVAQFLRAYEISGDVFYRDAAVDWIVAYDAHGWDEAAGSYYGMLALDGSPQLTGLGGAYGAYAPHGHVNVWRTSQYSYEFALAAAQATTYAYTLAEPEDQPTLLVAAERWAQVIEAALPARPGRRWGAVLRAQLPAVDDTAGTYAENYGRAISFFVGLYHASCDVECDAGYLQRAELLAHEAVDKLWHSSGLFRGHPAKATYQANDGVGFLVHALLELDAAPASWRPNF